jgi:hypothetical protein
MARLFVFDPLNSSHPQLRYAWNSTQLACEPVETDSSDLGFISIVLSDIAVSLIRVTLAGLFNLRRRHRGGTLARLLWKQVRQRESLPEVPLILKKKL